MRDALKDLADQFWPGDAVGDGAVGVDASVIGGVSVGEARETVVLHNADPPVRALELPDHAHRDFHGVVDDIVHADRVHAVDGQASISLEARLERIALFDRHAMVVAGRVHVQSTVHQVVDVCASLGANFSRYAMLSLSIADPFWVVVFRGASCARVLVTKVRTFASAFVPDLLASGVCGVTVLVCLSLQRGDVVVLCSI